MEKLRVMVLGAKGMLGSDLCKRIPEGWILYPFDLDLDITKKELVSAKLNEIKPDWVVNAVAYSDVDGAEKNPDMAFRVNRDGPAYAAEACNQLKIPLIHISTDYVFDGRTNKPYLETDATRPRSVYGMSKLHGEQAVLFYEGHYVLRTSSLYGHARMNHALRVVEAVKTGRPVKIVKDMICSPTYTGDMAVWIFDLMNKRSAPGLYHLCHKNPCSRLEFAEELCRLLQTPIPHSLETVLLKDLKLPAHRPAYSALDATKWEADVGELKSWQSGLTMFLDELETI